MEIVQEPGWYWMYLSVGSLKTEVLHDCTGRTSSHLVS